MDDHPNSSPFLVVGTAGHIDHGKSALVERLTGTDPDRLKEEQARGITIELGFAHASIGDATVSFVDVPGHERFVRTMLAGVGALDAVLLVVAADASVMPQTREHFAICRLLDIPRGVIALTKADLVDEDTAAVAALDVRALVAGSFLESAPIIPVSVRTGQGLDALRAALAALAGHPPRRDRSGVVRLPVDRAFSVKGFGTVVTGTLTSGELREGQELDVLPGGQRVRVRGVQMHGQPAGVVRAPARAAVNLAGVETSVVPRGVTIASPGTLAVTRRADARIEMLADAPALRHGARVRVHQGTSETGARLAIAAVRARRDEAWRPLTEADAGATLPPGGEAFVRLRFDDPIVLTRLDRFVIRAYSPAVTVGGGTVLDPEPPVGGLRRSSALARFERLDIAGSSGTDRGVGEASAEALASVVGFWVVEARERGLGIGDVVRRAGVDASMAARVMGILARTGEVRTVGTQVWHADVVKRIETAIIAALTAFHQREPLEAGLPRETLRALVTRSSAAALFDSLVADLHTRGLVGGTDRLALVSHQPTMPAADLRVRALIEARILEAALAPPDAGALAVDAGAAPAIVDRLLLGLVREGRIVRLGTLMFHAQALAALKADVRALSSKSAAAPARVDVASFKAKYGLSRKYAIPLLEWLDRERVTRRVGEARIVI